MGVLALYFPLDVEKEGFEKIKITQKKFENENTGVFFVHHNLPDDALKAVKGFWNSRGNINTIGKWSHQNPLAVMAHPKN